MIIVTGGCGFIGSNIVKHLNDRGIKDILVVDNLKNGHKFMNLTDLDIADIAQKIVELFVCLRCFVLRILRTDHMEQTTSTFTK